MEKAFAQLRKKAQRGFRGYPIATVAFYGPTNELASKVAASIVLKDGEASAVLERWFAGPGTDVRHDPLIGAAVVEFLARHRPRSYAVSGGVIGCPHEEGVDYPVGTPCPKCPFWAGRDRWREL